MSKPGIAPCGHPGTYVTNTFITCNLRCEFRAASPPPSNASARREPGHVDWCACAPCQIRRRAVSIELTTKAGVKFRLPWNGVDNKVSWTPSWNSSVRHWAMLDANDDVVVSGHTSFNLVGGLTAHVNIELFMDAAAKAMLTIEQCKWNFKYKPLHASKAMLHREPVEYLGTFEQSGKAGDVVSVSVRYDLKTFDDVYAEMQTAFKKHFAEPPTPLFDELLKITAERTAELYKLAELVLFPDLP